MTSITKEKYSNERTDGCREMILKGKCGKNCHRYQQNQCPIPSIGDRYSSRGKK